MAVVKMRDIVDLIVFVHATTTKHDLSLVSQTRRSQLPTQVEKIFLLLICQSQAGTGNRKLQKEDQEENNHILNDKLRKTSSDIP